MEAAVVDFKKIDIDKIKKVLSDAEENRCDTKKETVKINFECPVCGCEKYKGVFHSSPFDTIGGSAHCQEIECENCHVRLGIDALH